MSEKLYRSIEEFLGCTPLLELANIEKELNLPARVLAKLEYLNPSGSVKDRAAFSMIHDAEKKGLLKPGGMIIEPTSGNMGIGLAAAGAALGYRVIVVMPESMSLERRKLVKAYGARLVLTPAASGMAGAIAKAEELLKQNSGAIILGQFTNPANPLAHRTGTGPEIYDALEGNIDIFVAGVGTGGTVTGIGEYLKSRNRDIKVVAVEPADSPVLSGGKAGPHGIQGIGAGFVPKILDRSVIDEVMTAGTDEAFAACRLLASREGILAGISSGACLACALELASRKENTQKNIVALLPDSGERYLSTAIFPY